MKKYLIGVVVTLFLLGQTTCLMLTRRSTTLDLVAHLKGESVAVESHRVELASLGEEAMRLQARIGSEAAQSGC